MLCVNSRGRPLAMCDYDSDHRDERADVQDVLLSAVHEVWRHLCIPDVMKQTITYDLGLSELTEMQRKRSCNLKKMADCVRVMTLLLWFVAKVRSCKQICHPCKFHCFIAQSYVSTLYSLLEVLTRCEKKVIEKLTFACVPFLKQKEKFATLLIIHNCDATIM